MRFPIPSLLCARLLHCVAAAFVLAVTRIHAAGLHDLPDFDLRSRAAKNDPQRSAQVKAAHRRLAERVPGIAIDFDPISGAPKWIHANGEYLTGKAGLGNAVTPAGHRGLPPGDKYAPIKAFLNEHAELFGHDATVLTDAQVIREFESSHNGLRTTVWEQRHQNIPIFEAVLIGHLTADGRLVDISSQFLPPTPARNPKNTPVPRLSIRRAIVNAAQNVGDDLLETDISNGHKPTTPFGVQRFAARPFKGDIDARLVWLPMDRQTLRLCWDLTVTRRKTSTMYRLLVDANSGEILARYCLTSDLSNASYRVYTSDSPAPFSPGPPIPTTNQPPYVLPSLVVTNAVNTNASPNGWINDGDNETRGNNVDAHLDRDADDVPDLPRPQGSPNRVFDFTANFTQPPLANKDAALVNLFYWCNWYHDKAYELGFTEAAGNFQADNFGRGGAGDDPLMADAQDGSDFNNAFFSTPPADGSSPRMSLFIFNGPQPARDSAFDAQIILHEHTHGLSSRRVGGGVGIRHNQSRGLGEGWSDFYALTLLSEPADNLAGNYAFAGYSSFLLTNSTQMDNYYFGVRRYPYSTDLNRDPLTFKDIDPLQRSLHPGIPITSVQSIAILSASEWHAVGEVWCAVLWDARANFIARYGFAIGNKLILQLVTDGMNLTPPNPNFLQARDAIIQADLVNNSGANFRLLWTAFAKRGMGLGATCPEDSDTTSGVYESFDLPDDLLITPQSVVSSVGQPGGSFFPASQTYTITNVGPGSINWSVTKNSTWLNISNEFGAVSSGGPPANVTVSLNNKANLLPAGIYTATLVFNNQASGRTQSRHFVLRIGQPDYFTEIFSSTNNNDLAYTSWTFLPDGSGSFYSVCQEPATAFPVDPRTGRRLPLPDDGSTNVTVTGTNTVSIYGRRTNLIFIGSNGYITFDTGDSATEPNADVHFSHSRISALLDDLDPTAGGRVSWEQLGDRLAVTFLEVPEFSFDGGKNTNSFQIELFFDGVIRLTYLNVDARRGLVGLSDGAGVPSGFVQSDFSAYPSCSAQLLVSLPAAVSEGNGVLSSLGRVILPFPAPTNVTVTLKSSDTSELVLPSSILIPAGQSNALFNVTVVDDQILDGSQPVVVSASAPQYRTGSALILVHDNEVSVLSLAVPASISESAGVFTAILSAGAVVDSDVSVQLTSSDPARLQVPAEIILPVSSSSVSFPVSVLNNNRLQGLASVTITAHVQNWPDAVRSIQVTDDEAPVLSLNLNATLSERAGVVSGAGRLSIPGILSTNLVVTLSITNQSRITLPSTLLLPAGQTNVFFNIVTIDNNLADGNRTLSIIAQAAGFSAAAAVTTVIDDETPPAPSSPLPPHLSTDQPTELDLRWGSFDDSAPTTYAVYFGTASNPGASQLRGTTSATSWHVSDLLPGTVYFWKVVAQRTVNTSGPVWQFTTAGANHFEVSHDPGPEVAEQPFPIRVTARDALGHTVSNFTGGVELSALFGASPVRMFSEDFESAALVGWDGSSNPFVAVSSLTAADGTFALSLSGAPGDGISREFPGLRPARISFSVRAGNSSSSRGTLLLSSSPDPGDAIALFELAAHGAMGISDAFGGSYFIPYQANRWYRVALNIDWTNQTLDFFVDDALVEQNIPFYSTSADAVNFLHIYNQAPSLSTWDTIAFHGESSLRTVALAPPIASNFVDGVWTGQVSVQQPELGVYLQAHDAYGHHGESDRFDVTVPNDISLDVVTSSNPLLIGDELTYSARIFNSGPYPAEDVTLSSSWSAPVTVLSANSAQASCSNDADGVHCEVFSIPAGASAVVSIVISTTDPGAITNVTLISRPAADSELENNSRTTLVDVIPARFLSISNASVVEGDAGTTNAIFDLRLDGPALYPINILYATVPGSAAAGSDFQPVSGSLVLMPGITNAQVAVPVINDLIRESTETFSLAITRAENAFLSYTVATGSIIDNDPPPRLGVGDCIAVEPSSGFAEARFPVFLDLPSGFPIQANFSTADGTARAGTDYVATNGVVTIPAGATNGWITVLLAHDPLTTATEYFFVNLAIPVNASLSRAQGKALIVESAAPPCVSVANVAVIEGDNEGNAAAVFTLSLSAASSDSVSVAFHTQSGSAVGDIDYIEMAGVASFPPGATNAIVAVPILDDQLSEPTETFLLLLTDPVNCSICVSQATASILDDDPLPSLAIQDLVLAEGNLNWTTGFVQVGLSAPCGRPVTVDFLSNGGTATPEIDYRSLSGTLVFPEGATQAVFPVLVRGDILLEPDETILIQLVRPTNALLARSTGVVTILDDDGSPGILNHFEMSEIPSPQTINSGFPIAIRALDVFGAVATSFNGSVQLDALVMPPDIAIGNGSLASSRPLSAFYPAARSQILYLHSELGNAQTFTSLGLDIAAAPGQTLSNWTVRVKHTPLSSYNQANWDTTGWTIVCQTNLAVLSNGWTFLPFSVPFDYNGIDNLLIDLSFANAFWAYDGLCRSTPSSQPRMLALASDGPSNPLTWSGTSPAGLLYNNVPNIRLKTRTLSLSLSQSVVGPFSNGTWSGNLQISAAGQNVFLVANDQNGHLGSGNQFDVSSSNTAAFSAALFVNSGTVQIVWASIPGRTYRVEFKDSLAAPGWTSLPGETLADSTTSSRLDSGPFPTQRFYRVVRVP